MAELKEIKKQRDRFLAFAFASADLFMEVGGDGDVLFAVGAAKSLTGIDHQKLVGLNWLDVFSRKDRMILTTMQKQARLGQRCGPFSVKMDDTIAGGQKVIVTAIQMPDNENFYITVGFSSVLMQRLADTISEHDDFEMLDKDTFLYAAKEALDIARSLGQDLDMTLFDISGAEKVRSGMSDDAWKKFLEAMKDILGDYAFDGKTAGNIGQGKFSVIHDPDINVEELAKKIQDLAKKTDPKGKGLKITEKHVSADLQSLNERETMKALTYTISEFERKGAALNIETLNTSFKSYVSANVEKIQKFKGFIEQSQFDFNFHPIVHLDTHELSHFEILSRFHEGGSTFEWMIFAEDINMAADFDIAVCDRAINYLLYKSGGQPTKFAINLCGQSMQNEQFFKTLLAKLTMHTDLANRIIFEITESSTITSLEKVNAFIETLQEHGFRVCLDDFGAASAASLQHLQNLKVDFVKIEGLYTQKLMKSERDARFVQNLVKMCDDLNIQVIAERIETKEQAEAFKEMGVQLGQGYYFSQPTKKPVFDPTKIAKTGR